MALIATRLGMQVDPSILSWSSLPANLTLTQAWGLAPAAAWNHPSWSISAEWFAYLTFPIFALAALKLKDRPVVGLVLAMVLVLGLNAGFEALTNEKLTLATISWGALRIVPCFAFGCALYGYWVARPAKSRMKVITGALISGAATIFFAAVEAPDSVIVLGLGLTLLFLAQLAQTRSAILTQAPLVYLGEISYSIYMICLPWKIVFVNTMTRVFEVNGGQLTFGLWLVLLFGLVPISALSYHLIEKPARERMKLMPIARATHQSEQAPA
jgi:peptidoglycan/LPS O-acetylase OafA/YrhL